MNTDMKLQKVPVEKLKPAKYNPRKDLKPGDPAYEKIKRSMTTYGYVDPVIWNEVTGKIVGGHQRYKVLVAEGVKEIDCVVVHIENPQDEKALNIALNKAVGEWEPKALADLLSDLQLSGYDLGATGFDAAEVDDLFSKVHDKDVKDDNCDIDADELQPFVQEGDVWMLGRHRMVCGDSTLPENLALLMNGSKANLVVTDPPYNVSIPRVSSTESPSSCCHGRRRSSTTPSPSPWATARKCAERVSCWMRSRKAFAREATINAFIAMDITSNTYLHLMVAGKADKDDMDALDERISAAELKLTEDSIVSTVRGSQQYKDDLAGISVSGSGLEFIVGTQTVATANWTGAASFLELKDGQQITYWLPTTGGTNVTLTLTLPDDTTTEAIPCYYGGTTRLGTQYSAGSILHLTYRENAQIYSTTVEKGWWADANYDSNFYDRIRIGGSVKAKTAIGANHLVVGDADGYFNLAVGVPFDLDRPILWSPSSLNVNAYTSNLYLSYPVCFLRTMLPNFSGTQYAACYVVGTLNGSVFTPVEPLLTSIPQPESGSAGQLDGLERRAGGSVRHEHADGERRVPHHAERQQHCSQSQHRDLQRREGLPQQHSAHDTVYQYAVAGHQLHA